jgi:tetratricopeptide (TPR) repeat protein
MAPAGSAAIQPVSGGAGSRGEPAPDPAGATSWSELSQRLRLLRVWAGVSYRELHRRVLQLRRERGVPELPVYNTVYRCLQPGRARIDAELVADIAWVLLNNENAVDAWRQACASIAGEYDVASIVTVTTELPPAPRGFTGRRAALRRLLECAEAVAPDRPTVCAVTGMPGAGKTTLVVHALHRLWAHAAEPPTLLYVDLRGSKPGRQPAEPAAILDGMLRALGATGRELLSLDLAARRAMLDRLVAERRIVLVLDDAADRHRVRLVLPRRGPCLVLVTSRHRLAELPEQTVPLSEFSDAEALAVLRAAVGRDRVAAEADAAAGIIEMSGRLPLALALVTGRARADDGWTLTDHLERLTERRASLRLDDGVENAFAASYEELDADRRSLLRLLALHPGTDCDVYAAAACADRNAAATAAQLRDLVEAHLVEIRAGDRFVLHDLVRVFAQARARDEVPARERRQAIDRLLLYYRFATARAMAEFAPQERLRRPDIADPGMAAPELVGRAAARNWLDTERGNLLATTVFADEHNRPMHTALMSRLLYRYLDVAGYYHDAERLHTRATSSPDPVSRGHALTSRGVVRAIRGNHEAAVADCERALSLFQQVGDPLGQARARTTLGGLCWRLARYAEASEHLSAAGEIFAAAGESAAEGVTLQHLGIVLFLRGDDAAALAAYERAGQAARNSSDPLAEAHSLINAGQVLARMGQLPDAVEVIERGLRIARAHRNPAAEADGLSQLGAVLVELGETERGIGYLHEAIGIARRYAVRELQVQALDHLGRAYCGQHDLPAAQDAHRQALALANELGDGYQQARAHQGLARVAARRGDTETADAHYRIALASFSRLGTPEAAEVARELAGTRTAS